MTVKINHRPHQVLKIESFLIGNDRMTNFHLGGYDHPVIGTKYKDTVTIKHFHGDYMRSKVLPVIIVVAASIVILLASIPVKQVVTTYIESIVNSEILIPN